MKLLSKQEEFMKLLHNPYFLIIFTALLIRIIWVVASGPITPVSDCYAYDTFAQNLASGDGYGWHANALTTYWPPGTSFVYSIFYRLFGHTYLPIVIFNLLLSVVIVWATMQLAERWFSHRVALFAGLLLAFWPVTIQFTTVLSSELLFTALLLVAMHIWFNEDTSLWSRTLWVGLILAATFYVRTATIFIPFLLVFLRWISTREILKNLGAIVVMVSIIALLVSPWSIRNTKLSDQFVLMSTNTGVGLWLGNNPHAIYGGHMNIPEDAKRIKNLAQRETYLKAKAIEYIKAEPWLFIQRSFAKLFRLHSRETIGVTWNKEGLTSRYGTSVLLPLKIVSQAYWLLALSFALVGIVILGKQRGGLAMIIHPSIIVWGYFAFGHAVTEIDGRYHFYSIPMIAILAALTVVFLLKHHHQ
jgi:4-amino-4-deoxy-L-arabinose transferase-like glycosyltransferase